MCNNCSTLDMGICKRQEGKERGRERGRGKRRQGERKKRRKKIVFLFAIV